LENSDLIFQSFLTWPEVLNSTRLANPTLAIEALERLLGWKSSFAIFAVFTRFQFRDWFSADSNNRLGRV
jgi:hypothetical protein